MSIDLKTHDDSSQFNQFPFWSVKTGSLGNNEWGTNIEFTHIDESQWNLIRNLVQKYSTIRFRNCPTAYISESSHKIQFRFGHSASKPVLVVKTEKLSPLECDSCRNQLIECAEIFHKHGLGLWWLDRQLIWKTNGGFLFIPAFWLPAFGNIIPTSQLGMPPEYIGSPARPLSPTGDIYVIASFCFRALTGNEYDHGQPELPGDIRPELKEDWDPILDLALRKTPTRRPASFEAWKKPEEVKAESSQMLDRQINRRTVLKVIAAISVPVVAGGYFLTSGYRRGTGSYVVRFANRSYDGAKWEKERLVLENGVQFNNNVQFYNIGGWDVKNTAVSGSSSFVKRDGHWQPSSNTNFSKPYFTDAGTFYAFNSNNSPTRVKRYVLGNAVPLGDSDFDECREGYDFCQLNRNYFQFWGRPAYGEAFLYEITGKKCSEVSKDKNKIQTWINSKTPDEYSYTTELKLYHSFGNGKALAFQPGKNRMVLYRNGRWYNHHDTSTHEFGDHNAIWAMDKDNFILVSDRDNQGTITQFCRGKPSNLDTSDSNWKFSGFLAVWGVSMNKFWVLDNLGNVAQFDHGRVQHIIGISKSQPNGRFHDAWVSPEGAVYAITKNEVWCLG